MDPKSFPGYELMTHMSAEQQTVMVSYAALMERLSSKIGYPLFVSWVL
jgi:hypothetical protein